MEHLYVKFGDPSCIVFLDIMWKNRHTAVRTLIPMRLMESVVCISDNPLSNVCLFQFEKSFFNRLQKMFQVCTDF